MFNAHTTLLITGVWSAYVKFTFTFTIESDYIDNSIILSLDFPPQNSEFHEMKWIVYDMKYSLLYE